MALDSSALESFLGQLRRHHPRLDQERAAVLRALEAALLRARTKWPKVKVEDRAFLESLAPRLAKADGVLAGLTALRTSDLYVAVAATEGDPVAVESILEASRADVTKALRAMRLGDVEPDEVLQRLHERVFLSVGGARPKVSTYSGSGSLNAWLCAAASRLAIDLKRATGDVAEAFDEKLANALDHSEDPELSFLKEKYRRDFREIFQGVFSELPREDRNLLRLTFLDGLSIDELSPMLGLHRSSVARRIAKLREHLGSATRKRLRERLRLSGSELNSLMRLITSAFDVSLSKVLKEPSLPASRSRSGSLRSRSKT